MLSDIWYLGWGKVEHGQASWKQLPIDHALAKTGRHAKPIRRDNASSAAAMRRLLRASVAARRLRITTQSSAAFRCSSRRLRHSHTKSLYTLGFANREAVRVDVRQKVEIHEAGR